MVKIESPDQICLNFSDETFTVQLNPDDRRIRRCPRCGCAPKLHRLSHGEGMVVQLRVECANPGCDHPPTHWRGHSAEVIQAWNVTAVLQTP